VEEGDDFLE